MRSCKGMTNKVHQLCCQNKFFYNCNACHTNLKFMLIVVFEAGSDLNQGNYTIVIILYSVFPLNIDTGLRYFDYLYI